MKAQFKYDDRKQGWYPSDNRWFHNGKHFSVYGLEDLKQLISPLVEPILRPVNTQIDYAKKARQLANEILEREKHE